MFLIRWVALIPIFFCLLLLEVTYFTVHRESIMLKQAMQTEISNYDELVKLNKTYTKMNNDLAVAIKNINDSNKKLDLIVKHLSAIK